METPSGKFQLYSEQHEHCLNIVKILGKNFAALDTSGTGCGKTYTALTFAKWAGLTPLVIAPKSVHPNWEQVAKELDVPLNAHTHLLSYQTLAGKVKHGCGHGFLHRFDGEGGITHYELSPKGKELFATTPTLLVFDEVQNVKNDSLQTAAAVVLSSGLYMSEKAHSRVLCLSVAPTDSDKGKNLVRLFRILGVVRSNELYQYDHSSGVYNYENFGIGEMLAQARKLGSSEEVHKFMTDKEVNLNTSGGIALQIYHTWIKKEITIAMPPLAEIKAKEGVSSPDCKDGFYKILEEEDRDIFLEGKRLLESVVKREDNGYVLAGGDALTTLNNGLRLMEEGMISTLARLAADTLDKVPNSKVVLYVEGVGSEDEPGSSLRLAEMLEKHKPIVMRTRTTGGPPRAEGLPRQDRERARQAFQAPNLEYRLLITGPAVGGVGISLDDQHGGFPRYIYYIPKYNFMSAVQIPGRIFRRKTKSTPVVRFVWSQKFDEQPAILSSLMRKAANARQFIADGSVVKFPGEHERFYEE